MKSNVPEGKSGVWAVEKFTISEEEARFFNLRNRIQLLQGGGDRPVVPGIFTRLVRNGHVVMSDTPAEVEDLKDLEYNAKGHVLISGLGLGIAAEIAISCPDVTQVTVIEIDPDVVTLVGTHLCTRYKKSLVVLLGDIFKWKSPKGVRYGAVWHDIWDNICTDNLSEMQKLRRKFCRRAGWQGFWAYNDHLRAKRRW
jgi:hypothetical protein